MVRVCCGLCGAFLYCLAGDYVRVVGVCLTCVYREGNPPTPPFRKGGRGGENAVSLSPDRAVPMFLE